MSKQYSINDKHHNTFSSVELVANTEWQTVELNGETVEIPVGWNPTKLGDAFDISGGGTPPTGEEQYWGGGIPWIGPKFMSNDQRYVDVLHPANKTLTKEGAKKVADKETPSGSLIISSRAPVGYANIAPCDLFTNQGCYSFVDKGNGVPNYMYFWIRKNKLLLESRASGTTFLEISRSAISLIEYSAPPLPEQTLIANLLSTQEDHIASLKQRASLERKKLAFLTDELLSGRILVENDPEGDGVVVTRDENGQPLEVLPAVRLVANTEWQTVELNGETVEIPVGWEPMKLGDAFDISGGGTPSTSDDQYWGGGIPWVGPKFMSNNQRYVDINHPSSKTLTEKGAKKISDKATPEGSLIVSSRAPVGYANIAPCDLYTNQGCYSFINKNNGIPSHMYFWIRKNKPLLESRSSGTTFLEISRTAMSLIEYSAPPLPEQNLIANLLSTQEGHINNIQAEILHEERRLAWLSGALLSGKLLIKEKQNV